MSVSKADVLDTAIEEANATAQSQVHPSFLGRLLGRLTRYGERAFSTDGSDPKYPNASLSQPLPLPPSERLTLSQTETAYDLSRSDSIPATVLYLAYGSNLCYETFQGRRGIRPLAAVNVMVPELELVFDLPGLPYIEPCFANSARRNSPNVPHPDLEDGLHASQSNEFTNLVSLKAESTALIGVVYQVTAADYARIIATEGPAYTDVVVQCKALSIPSSCSVDKSTISSFKAHTLLAPKSNLRPLKAHKPAQPSLRYLTLCRNGAAEHNLPEAWQSYLNHLEHYQVTTLRQRIGRIVFVASCGPWLMAVLGLRRLVGDHSGILSSLVKRLTSLIFKTVWLSYDHMFKGVFGNGERTERY